ncbi:MAG: deoxyribonuclease I, partial [Armatimonadetes bacterium]|nr:deoxyribonuclease I [Armatimonadota bacterium]
APPGPGDRRGGPVIGNTASRVYHAPDCGSLPDRGRRQEFSSAAAARAAGYRPHRSCQ